MPAASQATAAGLCRCRLCPLQAEREAAVADLDAARATSKLLEEEVASLKQRLRQTEVPAASLLACTFAPHAYTLCTDIVVAAAAGLLTHCMRN
jgi:hypothetical protein